MDLAALSAELAAVPVELWIGLSALSLALAVVSLALMPRLLRGLPQDYLVQPPDRLRRRWARASASKRVLILLRNLAGLLLLLLGLVMLFVPGQGVLTVVAGLALLDLPGRHGLLVRLLSLPRVARAVDSLRKRGGVPPLDRPDEP